MGFRLTLNDPELSKSMCNHWSKEQFTGPNVRLEVVSQIYLCELLVPNDVFGGYPNELRLTVQLK